MSVVVRCPCCTQPISAEDFGAHLRGHSTWTIVRTSFKRWPTWTAMVVAVAVLLVAWLFAVMAQSGWV